jgi:hypothetical protein
MSWIKCSMRVIFGTVLVLVVSAASVLADPPGRVARLSFIGGSVSFRPASLDEWSIASVNYPLTIGDHIWTDRGGRSELQLGSSVVRIAPLTELSVLNLDDQTAQLRLTQGTLSVRIRNIADNDVFEIDTPNGAVSLVRPGLYRIDVNEAGDSIIVTVRQGEAEVTAASTFSVGGEQSAVLTGVDAPQTDVRAAVRIDEFEDWCLTRDRRAENAQTARYVSPGVIGYEDLEANGTWQTVPDYGPVWVPRVSAEWVPYRFGRWAWVEPWGWTWIDDASWGFAPFHYGRWAFLPARRWAWVPGTVVARPVYAPALVAFVGGSNWSASFRLGTGPVAWFPLGPREVFVPVYRVTPAYVQRVNVQHVTNVNVTNINVTNITYVNRAVPGAVTAVSRETFVQARPVGGAAVAVSREQLQTASVVGTAPQVAPQRVSVAGQAQARTATPSQAADSRRVVVRTAPPPPSAPFAARQAALEQHPGQPVDEQTERALRAASPQAPNAHPLVRIVTAPGARSAIVTPPSPAQTARPPVPAAPPVQTARPVPPVQTARPAQAAVPAVQVPATPSAAPPAPPQRGPTSPTPAIPPATPPAPAEPAAPAARGPNPPVAQPAAPPAVSAELAARHAKELADINARHAQERAALEARHQQAQKQVTAAEQRAQLSVQHQQEMKALQDRQKQERAAVQKRQEDERKKK